MSLETTVAPDADLLFDGANLNPEKTGLPFVVWISPRGNADHDVEIKVSPGQCALVSEMTTVAIRPGVRVIDGFLGPGDLKLLRRWVDMNRNVMIRFWDGDIADMDDVLDQLRSI